MIELTIFEDLQFNEDIHTHPTYTRKFMFMFMFRLKYSVLFKGL